MAACKCGAPNGVERLCTIVSMMLRGATTGARATIADAGCCAPRGALVETIAWAPAASSCKRFRFSAFALRAPSALRALVSIGMSACPACAIEVEGVCGCGSGAAGAPCSPRNDRRHSAMSKPAAGSPAVSSGSSKSAAMLEKEASSDSKPSGSPFMLQE